MATYSFAGNPTLESLVKILTGAIFGKCYFTNFISRWGFVTAHTCDTTELCLRKLKDDQFS